MSDENFAAGLARIACREGDDLELYQDDRAANARKTSPGTSYAEVQKSNSKHKAKASASRKRLRDTSNNEPDSSAPPPKHPASGKQSVSRPITKPPAALNARRSRPDSTDSSGKEASLASSIELESADDREALNLANVVASIPSSDDESEDLPLAKLVVPPISCPETSPVPQQSTGVASEAQFTRETRVASISPREAVSEVPASLSFTAIEPHQSLVSPTTRSDAESTSTLVFASGDESENNTPAGPAAQSSPRRFGCLSVYFVRSNYYNASAYVCPASLFSRVYSGGGHSRACLFGTEYFDPDSHVSQRAPPLARLKGFWRTFRGYGPEEDIDLGFSLWERDHWISARAIELFLSTGYRVLEEDSILASTTKAQLRLALDEAKAAWEEYAARVQPVEVVH
ncbi:hypothetical protein GQ600_12773 [Phytophthora cactorum]|nr:hypothetical protein GQ600_12773 [Phytophthora cactorum]